LLPRRLYLLWEPDIDPDAGHALDRIDRGACITDQAARVIGLEREVEMHISIISNFQLLHMAGGKDVFPTAGVADLY
jgi:hypothetical protein